MGITGLWPLVEPACQPITLESLEGKKLAVDVSIWIYQAQLGYSSETKCPHLALLINRLCKLLFYKIRPVFVFDGSSVPVFKRRVLEERRLRKHNEDVLVDISRKRHLEDLAKGPASQEEIDNIAKKLSSPSKKLRTDDGLFNIATTSSAPVIELSDDDADIVIEKEVVHSSLTSNRAIDALIETREKMRLSRLHPDMIPKDTETFCNFQLKRVLHRSRLNGYIKEMSKSQMDAFSGKDVKVAVADRRGQTHVISYDEPAVEIIEPSSSRSCVTPDWGEVNLTLSDLSSFHNEYAPTSANENSSAPTQEPPEFLSKSRMIEKLMKKRSEEERGAAVRHDGWSSESDDDDFIDVPIPTSISFTRTTVVQSIEPTAVRRTPERKDMRDDVEWNPSIEDDDSRLSGYCDESSQTQPKKDRDPGAYKDLQDFLSACGFPWIEAPGEAEAQCVELERLGIVQGVVSDDSDVLAFGGQNIYRHLFSKSKNVQYYQASKIESVIGLSQSDFIGIAIVSGADYSVGLRGIGVVAAIELLAEFTTRSDPGQEEEHLMRTLCGIDSWIEKKGSEQSVPDSTTILRKLRTVIERNNDTSRLQHIANVEIVRAYLEPNVDSSREECRWKSVDIPRIQQLVYEKMGWDEDQFDKQTRVSLEKWNEFVSGRASYQRHITSYAHKLHQSAEEQKMAVSKRARDAIARLRRRKGHSLPDEPSLICQASFVDEGTAVDDSTVAPAPAVPNKTRPGKRDTTRTTRGRTRAKRGRAAKKTVPKSALGKEELKLSEESSENEEV